METSWSMEIIIDIICKRQPDHSIRLSFFRKSCFITKETLSLQCLFPVASGFKLSGLVFYKGIIRNVNPAFSLVFGEFMKIFLYLCG